MKLSLTISNTLAYHANEPHIDEEQGCTLQPVRTAACKERVISLTLFVIGRGSGSRSQNENDEQEKTEIENDLLSLVSQDGWGKRSNWVTHHIHRRNEQPKTTMSTLGEKNKGEIILGALIDELKEEGEKCAIPQVLQ